jgi:hypothetical protein
MTDRKAEGLPSALWRASAAYLYTLDLDSPALAWEYLRRHPQYQADWARRAASLDRWGLRQRRRPPSRCARSATVLVHDG